MLDFVSLGPRVESSRFKVLAVWRCMVWVQSSGRTVLCTQVFFWAHAIPSPFPPPPVVWRWSLGLGLEGSKGSLGHVLDFRVLGLQRVCL